MRGKSLTAGLTLERPDTEKGSGYGIQSSAAREAVNLALIIQETAKKKPFAKAVVYPAGKDGGGRTAYSHLTYQQLDELSDRYAHGFVAEGIVRGTKTIVMVRPRIDFFGIMLGLYKIGAVPVLVDPGMGVLRMMHCHRSSGAEAFIGIPVAHALRVLAPSYFKNIKISITVGRRLFWGGPTARKLSDRPWEPFEVARTRGDELAMIAFTTGSTGPAKGVCYTHGMMSAQLDILRSQFGIGSTDVSLATFPAFALFDCGLGSTSVIPEMDPTKPARVDPRKIIEPILNHGVTYIFGSPALVRRVAQYGVRNKVKLPSLRYVLTGGAPVAPRTIEEFYTLMPESGEIFTPYGATEALPITSISGKEILADTRRHTENGYGVCIGPPVCGTAVKIIRIIEGPVPEWSDDLLADPGQIGEVVIQGPQVSSQYYNNQSENAVAKIRDGGGFWHRMGDVGWLDESGRLWMCGRKKHRVMTAEGTLFAIPCEAIFNRHPKVARSALVGVGTRNKQTPVICIEPVPGVKRNEKKQMEKELLDLARSYGHTKNISVVLFRKSFPVDVRHNAKIIREELAVWAEGRLQ